MEFGKNLPNFVMQCRAPIHGTAKSVESERDAFNFFYHFFACFFLYSFFLRDGDSLCLALSQLEKFNREEANAIPLPQVHNVRQPKCLQL